MAFVRNNLKSSSLRLAALLMARLFPRQTKATTLDGNNVGWTAGGLSQSFEIESNNAGNDNT